MAKELEVRETAIAQKIYEIRGKKVMLSGDLAALYEVQTKVLNQQVKRNQSRFPDRYMFKLTKEEYSEFLRSQNVTLAQGKFSKYPPYAFTEHGILMLSSILRSERAEQINIVIIDTFVKLREIMSTHKDILAKIEKIERSVTKNNDQIKLIFNAIHELFDDKKQRVKQQSRKRIGYKKDK